MWTPVDGSGSEKIIKLDVQRRQYDIVVIGEEPHPAYNRVSLSSFFEHRKVENLYLNPKEWVRTLRNQVQDASLMVWPMEVHFL